MNERLGIGIEDNFEKTEMHETMNNVDNSDYNNIHTNHTPNSRNNHTWNPPKQSEEPIKDKDTTTATTDENETKQQTKQEQVDPKEQKTIPRHLQDYILWALIIEEFKSLEVRRNAVTSSIRLTHFWLSAHNT